MLTRRQLFQVLVVCSFLLVLLFAWTPTPAIAQEPIIEPAPQPTEIPASPDSLSSDPGPNAIVFTKDARDVDSVPVERGDLLVQTSSSPTGLLIIKPDEKQPFVPAREKHLQLPVWNQRVSKSGLLHFQARDKDILAYPIDGSGGPGTAAKGDNQWRFSGPLAVGGLELYGAAVLVNEEVNQILIYEAYERNHHQTRIHRTHSTITWLGWAGKHGEHLYFLQHDDGQQNLYRFEPTFPSFGNARRDCYTANKPLTDCMMRAIRELPRKVSRVVDSVEGIWVSRGEMPEALAAEFASEQ